MSIIERVLKVAYQNGVSDVHIAASCPIVVRRDGRLQMLESSSLTNEQCLTIIQDILNEKQLASLDKKGQADFSYSLPGVARFRGNAYKQRGSYNIAFRAINSDIPTIDQLRLPNILKELSTRQRGLILVTGPTGSGKSTTLASMINHMNANRTDHIITIEDPIEYLHKNNRSIINQREVGSDTDSFDNALRAALRQDPDVIQVGEMRDLETIATALTAAETGHLVLSTLHTVGGAKSVDRIIDAFNPHQQQQIRLQLSTVLEAIISQQIIPRASGRGRVVAFEIMLATPAIRNLIREAKTPQIQTQIQTGARYGMQTMDSSLLHLYANGEISLEMLKRYAVDLEFVNKQIGVM